MGTCRCRPESQVGDEETVAGGLRERTSRCVIGVGWWGIVCLSAPTTPRVSKWRSQWTGLELHWRMSKRRAPVWMLRWGWAREVIDVVTRGTALESAGCVEAPTIISLPVLPILPQRPTWLHLCGRRLAWMLQERVAVSTVDGVRVSTRLGSWICVSDVR